jgi:nitrous oxide reductase accessory protein NosL
MKRLALMLLLPGGLLAGCQKEETAKAPEPPVQNAFTDYVGSRVTAMNKAESVADKANAVVHQGEQQAQSAQEQ